MLLLLQKINTLQQLLTSADFRIDVLLAEKQVLRALVSTLDSEPGSDVHSRNTRMDDHQAIQVRNLNLKTCWTNILVYAL